MRMFRIVNAENDHVVAVAALTVDDAVAKYMREYPPDLMVDQAGDFVELLQDIARFPLPDWAAEVANHDTTLGYDDWLAEQLTRTWQEEN